MPLFGASVVYTSAPNGPRLTNTGFIARSVESRSLARTGRFHRSAPAEFGDRTRVGQV
jgi:hypothetical protein